MTTVADSSTVGSGLDQLLARLPAELDRWHAPGLELAVVRGGEAVVAAGFGHGVLEPATPVTAQTLFHHGSCGKAFTALLAAVLAEDGLIDLDAPVRTHVPELRLPDPVIAERATMRDLLSHRAGLDRHDLAWILNPSWSREELVRRLAHLPLCGELRGQWQYSNFGYALAGLAMERAAGESYANLLAKHIFEPVGLTRTRHATVANADTDQAEPYLVRDGAAVRTEWRVMSGMAPAGGVLMCADDSVRWLLLQLGHGPIDADVVRRTHHLHVAVPPEAEVMFPGLRLYGYAMGWVVATLRGRRLLWHSGGVDGFTTYTLLMPDDDIGVVASINLHLTQMLPLAIVLDIADALTGETTGEFWADTLFEMSATEPAAPPAPRRGDPPRVAAHALEAYAGVFGNDGYGDLHVDVVDGQLAFQLGECAVESSHRHFDTWDLRYPPLDTHATVSFATAADGAVDEAVVVFDIDETKRVRYVRRERNGGTS